MGNIAADLELSPRDELEITDLNRVYLGRGTAWPDAGTHQLLLQTSTFVQAIQDRQGMMISCPEEIVWRMGFIDNALSTQFSQAMKINQYGQYLLGLVG